MQWKIHHDDDEKFKTIHAKPSNTQYFLCKKQCRRQPTESSRGSYKER